MATAKKSSHQFDKLFADVPPSAPGAQRPYSALVDPAPPPSVGSQDFSHTAQTSQAAEDGAAVPGTQTPARAEPVASCNEEVTVKGQTQAGDAQSQGDAMLPAAEAIKSTASDALIADQEDASQRSPEPSTPPMPLLPDPRQTVLELRDTSHQQAEKPSQQCEQRMSEDLDLPQTSPPPSAPLPPPAPRTPSPPPPLPLAVFSRAQPPQLREHPRQSSLVLWWEDARQIDVLDAQEGETWPPCPVGYMLQLQQVTSKRGVDEPLAEDRWSAVYSGSSPHAQVTGLLPGRRYALRVVLRPQLLPGYRDMPPLPPSPAAVAETQPASPEAPPPARLVGRARNFLKFKWLDPDETGGRRILRYQAVILQSGGRAEHWDPMCDGPDNSYKLSSLRPAVKVVVKYQVFNEVGESPWSPAVSFTTASAVPDIVSDMSVAGSTSNSIAVQWQEPAANGEPIEGYRLEIDDGLGGAFELAYQGIDRMYEAMGLESGRTYRFRVCASNQVGTGLVSLPLSCQTAAMPPSSPPQPGVNSVTQTTAMLSWGPPPFDGGAPITRWKVELQPKSKAALVNGLSSNWTTMYEGRGTACTLNALRPGCVYRVRVAACNSAGWGAAGFPANVAAAPTAPDTPQHLQVVRRTREALSVTWQPPTFDGGAPLAHYRLELRRPPTSPEADVGPSNSSGGGVGWATAATCQEAAAEVGGLQPGTDYQARVYAINALGSSPPTDPLTASTNAAPPGAPSAPTLEGSPAGTSLNLRWSAPQERGVAVAGYTLQTAPHAADPAQPSDSPTATAAAVQWQTIHEGKDSAAKVRQLVPAMQYVFRVRATSSVGAGDWSPPATFCTSAAAPSAPTHVAAFAAAVDTPDLTEEGGSNAAALQVSWQPPQSNHGAPVGSYTVEVAQQPSRGRSDLTWQLAYSGPSLSCTVAGLKHGRLHSVRVRASNVCGAGGWSAPASARTRPGRPIPPPPPTVSQVTSGGLRAKWDSPTDDNGAPVIIYRLEATAASSSAKEVYAGPETAFKVTGLQPGHLYHLRVQACNAEGSSAFSEAVAVHTAQPPPPPPAALTAALCSSGRSILAQWDAVTDEAAHAPVASYEAEAAPRGPGAALRGTAPARLTQCTLSGASPGVTYQVRVRAAGAAGAGHGAWSAAVEVCVPCSPAQTPAGGGEVRAAGDVDGTQCPPSSGGTGGGSGSRRRAGKRAPKLVEAAKARGPVAGQPWTVRRVQREFRRHDRLLLLVVVLLFFSLFAALLLNEGSS